VEKGEFTIELTPHSRRVLSAACTLQSTVASANAGAEKDKAAAMAEPARRSRIFMRIFPFYSHRAEARRRREK
jgi:hypothetical protein